MKSQQEKMGDERTDIRVGDEKIEGEVRGMENGGGAGRNIQMRLRFRPMCPCIRGDTELDLDLGQ